MHLLHSVTFRRLALAGFVLAGVWLFFAWEVAPFERRAAQFHLRQAKLQSQIDDARRTFVAAKELEQSIGPARVALNEMIGGPGNLASFPAEIERHFAGFGIPSAVVRLATIQKEPALHGYQRVYWSVGLPEADRNLRGLLRGVAELEKTDRFIKVTDFVLQPHPQDPTRRVASVSLMVLARD